MSIQLSENQVTVVKKVLFGNQKQANVTNEAVVKIVARGIAEVKTVSVLDSEESFATACKEYLQGCIDKTVPVNETLVMLLAGEASLANINSDGPRVVSVDQPNPESPKVLFRVHMLGEEATVDMSAESGEVNTAYAPVTTHVSTECAYDRDDDLATRARKIKDAILPLCPAAVVAEIPDNEYAQALCYAEYYYRNIFNG